jgi:hypothetical protein
VSEPDRLQRERPDLAALIAGWPDHDRERAVRQVVERIAETTGVADDCRAASDLGDLVQHLDEKAWDLQEHGESVEYERAFARARAANAWSVTTSGNSVSTCREAIYEALHAANVSGADITTLLAE